MAASTASLVCAWVCGRASPSSLEMSAKARFLLPLLWAVKMSGLDFEGRGRPLVMGVVLLLLVVARREDRVDVKAALVEWLVSECLEVRGRGRP